MSLAQEIFIVSLSNFDLLAQILLNLLPLHSSMMSFLTSWLQVETVNQLLLFMHSNGTTVMMVVKIHVLWTTQNCWLLTVFSYESDRDQNHLMCYLLFCPKAKGIYQSLK